MTVGEQWKDVLGWEGLYEISDKGRVRSIDKLVRCKNGVEKRHRGRVLKCILRRDGRFQVSLKHNGVHDIQLVHRLVLEAFVGPCPEGMEACHNNGNPKDNGLSNLRWDSHLENQRDKIKHGTSNRGEEHPLSVLSECDVLEIREMCESGSVTQKDVAALFGISRQAVYSIVHRKNWRHI